MPLFITAVELRAGVEADDRKWNQSFCKLGEEISNEINSLRLVLGDKMKVELAWQKPLGWPVCALRTPDGRRFQDIESQEMMRIGVRSATRIRNHALEAHSGQAKRHADYGQELHGYGAFCPEVAA